MSSVYISNIWSKLVPFASFALEMTCLPFQSFKFSFVEWVELYSEGKMDKFFSQSPISCLIWATYSMLDTYMHILRPVLFYEWVNGLSADVSLITTLIDPGLCLF